MKTNPVKNVVSLLATMTLSMLSGCNNESNDATQALVFDPLPDQFKENALNIGSISNAHHARNAILLAVKQVNDVGGVLGKELNAVAFVASGVDEATRQAEKLLTADIKIINVSYSSRSKAVAPLAIAKQIPIISESSTATYFTGFDDDDFYFRMVPSDVIQSRILAEIAIDQGYRTAVTVHNDGDQYGINLVENFQLNFAQLGGTVLASVAIPFTTKTGFDHYLQIISEKNPELILDAILEGDESANFVNESQAFGIESNFLFPDASAGVASFANNIVNVDRLSNALGTAAGFGLATNPDMIAFDHDYQQQFAQKPDSFNVTGFDLVMVAALAIERAGYLNNTDNPSGLMIRDSLRAVMNPPGEIVRPSNIAQGLQWLRNGIEVNYSGAYGATDWDANGDVAGEITYDVLSIDPQTKTWKTVFQQQLFVPLNE